MEHNLGLLIVALFCLTSMYASTAVGTCNATGGADPAVNTNPPGTTPQPVMSGVVFTCVAFTIPVGSTLTSVDLSIGNDYSLGAIGSTNTVQFSYVITGFTATALTTSVTGGITSSAGGIVSQAPLGGCTATGANAVDCLDGGLSMINPPTTSFGAVTVTGSSTWLAGGAGPNGSDQFNVQELFTYSPTVTTPEPGSLFLIGGGLIGLALAARRKFRA
jgi:hypothetical protein